MNVAFRRESATMKSNAVPLTTLVTCWLMICSALTPLITGGLFTSGSLVVFITLGFTPAMFKPLAKAVLFFRPRPFVLMKKRRRIWLHLNPWLGVGHPGLRDMNGYWRELTDTLRSAMKTNRNTIILSSHLLSPRRIARLLRHFHAEHYHCRTLSRPVSRTERTGLQIDTFLKEWRWYTPSMQCGILVIRKKEKRQ
ncbi:hypothetical protein D3C81_294130 [compost metagenome]